MDLKFKEFFFNISVVYIVNIKMHSNEIFTLKIKILKKNYIPFHLNGV